MCLYFSAVFTRRMKPTVPISLRAVRIASTRDFSVGGRVRVSGKGSQGTDPYRIILGVNPSAPVVLLTACAAGESLTCLF